MKLKRERGAKPPCSCYYKGGGLRPPSDPSAAAAGTDTHTRSGQGLLRSNPARTKIAPMMALLLLATAATVTRRSTFSSTMNYDADEKYGQIESHLRSLWA